MNTVVRRLWGVDAERKSRFHTRRGELMPTAEIARIPVHIARRFLRRHQGPWMADGAVRWLDQNLTRDMTLLELGAGSSTAWYAARVGRVVAVEPDPEWHRHVAESVANCRNVELVSSSVRSALAHFGQNSFHVVIVDHSESNGDVSRPEVLADMRPKVSIVVLDDSDRPAYQEAVDLMSDWTITRYRSYRSRPLSPTETTIFTRTVI